MYHLFLCLVFICLAAGEERLLQFNESFTMWVPEEEIEKLSWDPNLHFIDITDIPEPTQNKKMFTIPVYPSHMTVVRPLLSSVNPNNVWSTIQSLSAYQTRYYTSQTGLQAANWLYSQYSSYAANYPPETATVLRFSHSWLQPSIIARIPGTVYPNEVLIIGGHIDSTSSSGVAPGADDDASGSATVLEVFRVLTAAGFLPERTIEFHGYAAEEAGLRGSAAIAENYANNGINVVAMLQFDMTGYTAGSATPTIGVVTDFVNSGLTTFVRNLINEYLGTGRQTNTQCGYGCSDHASWTRNSYASSFVFESTFANSNPYIHTSSDTLSRLNRNHAEQFARLGVAFCGELAFNDDK
jgi:leucyl aminopeptidase